MVSIPVRLYPATESKDISFHMLHSECHNRVRQKLYCPVDEVDIDRKDTVKGYEYAKGQHVILTDEDFQRLPLASKHTIELSACVKADEIDSIYYEKTYYLEPAELGVKPYALLTRALESRGLTALAKIAIRNKEQLCALRPSDGTLVLETLFYADEIRQDSRPEAPAVQISRAEEEMASTLVDMLAEPFEPEKYKDEYRDALMEVIEAKLQGVELEEEPEPAPTKVADLMAALKASVAAVEASRKAKADAPAASEPRGGGKKPTGVPKAFREAFDAGEEEPPAEKRRPSRRKAG
jgi:DNA end-binding protein Ku